MPHPLVVQLRFARSEFARGLEGVADEEARRRLAPMNSLSWTIGHLANQEQMYWLFRAQGRVVVPGLSELVGSGQPASQPPLADMWAAWQTITAATDPYLDQLTDETLLSHMLIDGKPHRSNIGTNLLRVIYHYWYHTGETQAVRQLLGHHNVGNFVGNIDDLAPYRV